MCLFWFSCDLTVWVHRPPRGSSACLLTRKKHWHFQSVHLIRLKLSFYFQILDLWPTLQVLFGVGLCLFVFFNLLKAQTDQTVIWPNSQQPRHTQQGVLEKVLETNCLFCGANWTKGRISTFLFVFTLKTLKKKNKKKRNIFTCLCSTEETLQNCYIWNMDVNVE